MRFNVHIIILVAIVALGIFLRFYKLDQIPNGLQQDETSIGYNAYSILMTGRDEHGQAFPLYFKAFGEYKLPGYIYASIVPIWIFGLSAWSVRFTSALAGSLTVILMYFLTRRLVEPKDSSKIGLMATFFIAINPWHLHFSRGAFEVTLALFFLMFGIFFFLHAIQMKRMWLIPISLIVFIASIYTYNITRVVSPLILIALMMIFRKELKGITARLLLISVITALVALIPFIISLPSRGGFDATKGTLIFSSAAVQAPLLEFRSYFISLPSILNKFLLNQFALTMWRYVSNIISYFSAEFLFLTGSTHGNHGIGTTGQFYIFEFPLMILGIIYMIRRLRTQQIILCWLIISIAVAAFTREAPHATRGFFLIPPMILLSAYGLLYGKELLLTLKPPLVKYSLGLLFIIMIMFNISYYFLSYYIRFPIAYAPAWRSEDAQLSKYLVSLDPMHETIIFDSESNFIYTSLLFYTQFPPDNFQNTVIRQPDDSEGFSSVVSFGKYEFRPIDWTSDVGLPNTLLVSSPNLIPENMLPLRTFYYPKRPIVIAVKEMLQAYPVEEAAYAVVSSQ